MKKLSGLELENAKLNREIALANRARDGALARFRGHRQEFIAAKRELVALKDKEKKNVWGTMNMPLSASELSAIVGIILLTFSMVGYLLDIPPFHLHPDYSKDPCVTGNIYCLRMNPEFNPIPVAVGMLLLVVGVATMDEVEGRGGR